MNGKMSKVKIEKFDKRSKLIDQIKAIGNQLSGLTKNIHEEDKIALVLEKSPKEYAGILAVTEKEKGTELTMSDLKYAMKIQYPI